MGKWEDQTKRTNQRKELWTETQQFSFITALLEATNEEEVKAAYIREFALPVKTQERHDLVVNKVLFEFKYSVRLSDIGVAAKVVAQAIYYINRLFRKGRLSEVEHLIIADKDEARIFKVTEFQLFYESHEYQWDGFRPSSPDPKLIEAIRNSKILESNRIYNLTFQDDSFLFSSRLYKILSISKTTDEHLKRLSEKPIFQRSRLLMVSFGLFLILLSGVIAGSQYYSNGAKQSVPANQK